jgi:hypothetical protein
MLTTRPPKPFTQRHTQNARKEKCQILIWCGEKAYISEFLKTETIQENYMETKA